MKVKKSLAVLAVLALTANLLGGCGKSDDTSSGGSKESSSSGSNVIKIATQSPLSGANATLGESIKLGAQLKLEESQEKFKALGFKLQLVPMDDQADPKKGVSNAQQLTADPQVFAVVGHLNSGVAIPSSEIYEKSAVPMVSPSNTALEVTDRGLKSVNRICARDDFQGPAAAKYAYETLGVKNVFVIQDKTAYGSGLADAFKKGFEELGGKVVKYEGITVGEKDFNGVINQIVANKPDMVYFGGMYTEFGLLIKQSADKGITIPFMGGDGADSSGLVQTAGDSLNKIPVTFTSVAGDVNATPEGQTFATNYKEKFNKNVEAYSAYGYDCMGTVLQGLENAINSNGGKLPSHEQVRDAIRAIQDYKGIVTEVGFDDIGDNKFAKVFIYKYDGPKYPGVQESVVQK